MAIRASKSDDPRLQLEPASLRSRLWLFLLTVALPMLLMIVLPLFLGDARGAIARFPGADLLPPQLLLPMWVMVVTVPIWAAINWLMSRHRLSVDAGGIEVVTTLYRNRVPLQELELDAARVIDIDEYPERRPFFKTSGVAMPGFRSGWFHTRKLKKEFIATAGGKRLLWLPTTRGYALLLQPRNPKALLDRLLELKEQHTHL